MTAPSRVLGFRARLVAALVLAVATAAVLVGAISVPVVRSSLQESLRQDAIADTRATLSSVADESALPALPTDDQVDAADLVPRLLARGADGVWIEVPGRDPYVSSLAMLDGPGAVAPGVRDVVDRGEVGWQFTTIAGAPVLVTGGMRASDGTTIFTATSTAQIARTVQQLQTATVSVAVAVALLGSGLAWVLANGVLRPVARAGAAARRMAAGDLDTDLPTGPDQVGQLGVAFNTMAASLRTTIRRLEQARDRERQFVADASHDLRTPVTGVVNAAHVLARRLDDDADPDTRRLVAAMEDEAIRLASLVEALLEVTRTEGLADDPSDVPSPVDIDAELRDLVAERMPGAAVHADVGQVVVPTTAFHRILGNLLDNARVHGRGRDVVVTARRSATPPPRRGDGSGPVPPTGPPAEPPMAGPPAEPPVAEPASGARPLPSPSGEWLVVEVSDRGPGIPPDLGDRAFDRLTTGARARGQGSGLGLAIAHGHARRLGGDLWAQARPGGGTLMVLAVPVARLMQTRDDDATVPRHDDVTG